MKLHLPRSLVNPVSLIGAIVATVNFCASTILLFIDLLSHASNPYRGMFAYAVFPSLLFFGLFLVAFGAIRQRRRAAPAFPVVDLNLPRQRKVFFSVATSGLLFIFLSALGAYRAFEFTESVTFCGTLCHEVMKPEYTAYLSSPHARVKCVECHVGEGAEWFVKAKLSGLYQVYATLLNKYPRPIPTPIENLRPARDTCSHCHWPEKFWGAQLSTQVRFSFDVASTRREILMLVKTGGGGSTHGPSEGIHWHADPRLKIEYMPRDTKRMDIPWVRITYPDGASREYVNSESPPSAEDLSRLPRRIMDCMDCHNRPSHAYVSPEAVADRLLAAGKIDAKVPYIKTVATEILAAEYASSADAAKGIEEGLLRGYGEKHPEIVARFRREISAAVPVIQEAYRLNFFPEMKASWSVYPNHISHKEYPGCFRCHNETHKDSTGKALGQSCELCHTFVQRSPGGESLVPIPADPTTFHPWTKAGRHSTMNCWDCHNGKSSPYGTCGNCHTIDPAAPMAFACITCHQPAHESAAAGFKSCVSCHATGGSSLHVSPGHRNCADCHEAHDWKSEDPRDCTQSCHGELAKTHYPEQDCSPCHDFRGVTSGFGSAPVPRAARLPQTSKKAPTEGETKTEGDLKPEEKTEGEPEAKAPPTAPAGATAEKAYGPDCLRSGCHSDLLEKPAVHGPVASGACNRCHQAVQGGEHEFKLVAEEEEICVSCHVLRRDRKVVHKPFEKSSCLSCHDPHGGSTRELLASESAGKLCLDCHSIPEDKGVHAPVREGECAKCHASHQSDHAKLFPRPEPEVCTECHGSLAKEIAEATVVHKPVREGCGSCHKGHASANAKLLSLPYAADLYAPYGESSYALCFHCHARDLFGEPRSKLTGFRDAETNLHYVHVHGDEKGRTCRACHVAHAGDAPKLMAASVPYGPGGWRLPIGFEPTPTGGKCSSGCHAEKSYDRSREAKETK